MRAKRDAVIALYGGIMRSTGTRWLLLVLGVLVVVALWFSTIWLLPRLAQMLAAVGYGPSERESFGLVGDMFGAVNALFSGLALGAIALTLFLEARSRRESRKPLVVGGLESGEVTIGRPLIEGGETLVPLRVPIMLSNQSDDAALNVAASLSLLDGSRTSWSVSLDGPLLREIRQEAALEVKLREREWMYLLAELTSQRPVKMQLSTTYRSLEGVNWRTIVVYKFYVRTTDQHYGRLDPIRNGTWNDDGVWKDDGLVPVSTQIEPGSWDHMLA